jgi:hypothetical protein
MKRLNVLIAAIAVALAGPPAISRAAADPEPDFVSVNPRGSAPVAPDGDAFVWRIFGTRPTEDNIVSATGAYAGRTGHLSVSGTVDMRGFPSPIPYEGVGVLVFDD